MADGPFRVIAGGEGAKPKRAKPRDPAQLLYCPACKGNAMMHIKLGMEYSNGRAKGGRQHTICARCFMGGTIVTIAF